MRYDERIIERTKEMYSNGTRIELNSLCNDERDMPKGLRGTVVGVDDQPSLLMHWDNAKTLSVFPGEDSFRKLTPEEVAEEQSESMNEIESGPKMEM